ncbi:hypothetical protein FQA39_LY08025 [Lamprigera yunnana]|nr:hypothetical protein FQA39_LY08025 [Lamprigera yunnana]
MKLYVACITLLLKYALAYEYLEFSDVIKNYESYMKNNRIQCIRKSHVEPYMIDDLLNKGVFVENENLKEYFVCVYLDLGMLTQNGAFVKKEMLKYIGVDNPIIKEKIYGLCSKPKGDKNTEKVWHANFNIIIRNYENNINGICIKESKVSPSMAEDSISKDILVDNKELKEFQFCIHLKAGAIDKNGNLNKDMIIFYLGTGDAKIDEAFYEKCRNLTADTATEKMWKVLKCRQSFLKSVRNK